MKFYQSIRKLWQQPKQNLGDLWQKRLVKWRKEASTVKLKRPTRLDRARSLGYRSKEGILVFRQKIPRGGKKKQVFGRRGRRPKRYGQKLVLDKSYQQVAEERVAKKHPNLEVLNSYYVAKDGKYAWYEIITVDWAHPAIRKDKNLKWIVNQPGRVFRGLTSIGKKSRGLRHKGKGAEKLRPSRTSNTKRRKL